MSKKSGSARLRGLMALGVAGVLVLGLLTAALVPFLKDHYERSERGGDPPQRIGVGRTAAGCQPVRSADASGTQLHRPPGTRIQYADAPPAFGEHWDNFLTSREIRPFFTTQDRPPVERLVHSLEHGYTIVWYDDTLEPGTTGFTDLQRIASKLGADRDLIAAPWGAADGADFPAGTHVALTHWTGPARQRGIWEYCAAPSGAVIEKFTTDYPKADSPEPHGY